MKRLKFIFATIVLLAAITTNAQDQDCGTTYNLFKGEVKTKRFEDAYPKLIQLLENCPKLSVNIYKYGDQVAEYRYKNEANKDEAFALVKRIYNQRLQHFPDQDPAKVHNDYASFLADNNLASDDEVFNLLETAYKISPNSMGVKNIYKYFQGVTDKFKDSDPQKVFDTYDDVLESVGEKLDYYKKKLAPLLKKVEDSVELDKREKTNLRAYTINSEALGTIENGLDAIIIDLSTCERLIPLYTRDLEANKTNTKWLKRAASRLYAKDCTDDPLYEKIVGAWVEVDPSPKTTVFYAGILYKKGKEAEATEYYKKAVDQQTDPNEKADILYKVAQLYAKKGNKSQARNFANKALAENPNLGVAYLLIAQLYASSANSCGNNEFEKRMVYTAAKYKAQRAAAVDPSIASKAAKSIKNYESNEPSKKLIFNVGLKSGSSHTIKCWIGETVKVPNK